MKNILFITYLSFLSANCFSQSAYIYFDNNSNKINANELNKITFFIAQNKHNTLTIIGYADTVGKNILNENLSKSRAIAVKQLFLNNGFNANNIIVQAAGETNSEEAFLALNRRVEVFVNNNSSNNLIAFKNSIAPKPQVFELSEDFNVLKSEKGIEISINKNDLEFEDASSIAGAINIALTEYLDYKDFFSANLFTLSNGKPLQTKGMAYITAYQNDKKIRVKKGKTYTIKMPTEKEDGFETFYGIRGNDNIVNWVLPNEDKKTTIKKKRNNNEKALEDSLKLYNIKGDFIDGVLVGKPEQKINYKNLRGKLNEDSIGVIFMNNTLEVVDSKTSNEHQKSETIKANATNFGLNDDSLSSPKIVSNSLGMFSGTPINGNQFVTNQTLTSSGFGWINCDRFIPDPNMIYCNFNITVKGIKDFTAVLMYKNIKSMLPINCNENFSQWLPLPPNESVYLMIVGKKEKEMSYYFEQIFPKEKEIKRDAILKPILEEDLKDFFVVFN